MFCTVFPRHLRCGIYNGQIAPRIAKRRSVTASLKKVLTEEVGEDSTEADYIKNLRLLRESLWPNHGRSSMMVIGNEKQGVDGPTSNTS